MSKIAMVVANPCAPDHRVVKQAEFLASLGHNVRIYCRTGKDIPVREIVNGVEYVRIEINLRAMLKKYIFFWQ